MEAHFEIGEATYLISDDKKLLDLKVIHRYLAEDSYWGLGIPLETVSKSIANSLCIAVYQNKSLVGFSRIVSDYSTFAYLCDVFVSQEFRGKGISKRMMQFIMQHPDLQNLRRWMLMTKDAHLLYKQFGWNELSNPDKAMEISHPNIYRKNNSG